MSDNAPSPTWRSTSGTHNPPAHLALFRLDPDPVSMIRLLDLKNLNKELFLDPSVEGDVYKLPPWLLIPPEEEPQLSDTHEFLLYSPRHENPRNRAPFGEPDHIRRKLEGEASILYWGMNGSPSIIVDPISRLTIGCYSSHTLCVTGQDHIKLNWHMTEYRSTRTDYFKSLCKVHMGCESLRIARLNVKACEKLFKSTLLKHNQKAEKLGVAEDLPPKHRISVDLAKYERGLELAGAALREEVARLRQANVDVFDQILGRPTLLQPAPVLGWSLLRRRTALALRDGDDQLEEVDGNVRLKEISLSQNSARFRLPV